MWYIPIIFLLIFYIKFFMYMNDQGIDILEEDFVYSAHDAIAV